jgi:hypothetical protein
MMEPATDTLHQIVSLFHLTQPMTIPQGEDDWTIMEMMNLSEAAALSLALSFFLCQTGNRAERLQPLKIQKLISVKPAKESCDGRSF